MYSRHSHEIFSSNLLTISNWLIKERLEKTQPSPFAAKPQKHIKSTFVLPSSPLPTHTLRAMDLHHVLDI